MCVVSAAAIDQQIIHSHIHNIIVGGVISGFATLAANSLKPIKSTAAVEISSTSKLKTNSTFPAVVVD